MLRITFILCCLREVARRDMHSDCYMDYGRGFKRRHSLTP